MSARPDPPPKTISMPVIAVRYALPAAILLAAARVCCDEHGRWPYDT